MLSREEAASRLQQYAAPAGTVPTVKKSLLGGALQEQLTTFLSADQARAQVDRGALAKALDETDQRKLARLLSRFAPELGPPLARWWSWATLTPYQLGMARRG